MDFLPKSRKRNIIHTVTRITVEVMVIFAFFIVLGLVNKNFVFFSKDIYFSYLYPDNQKIITPLSPVIDQAVIGENKNDNQLYKVDYQIINKDTTQFSLNVPVTVNTDNFKEAKVSVVFDPYQTQEILIGPKNTTNNEFDYQPIYNWSLEQLAWPKLATDGLLIWQKNEKYDTLDEFMGNPPQPIKEEIIEGNEIKLQTKTTIASYYNQLDQSSIILNSLTSKQSGQKETSTPYFEGGFTAYTFLTSPATLKITATKHDHNFYNGDDAMNIEIYDATDNLIGSEEISDDGNIDSDGQYGPPQTKEVILPNLGSGLYKIQTGTGDAYTKLSLNQNYLIIEDGFMMRDDIFESNQDPFIVYTNAQSIKIPSWHIPDTNQTLTINDQSQIALDSGRVYQPYTFIELSSGEETNYINKIQLEINHLGLQSNEPLNKKYFSFSLESFFDPNPLQMKRFEANTDLNEDSPIAFILTSYHGPKQKENFLLAEKIFNLSQNSYFEDNVVTFAINAPGLQSNNNNLKIISLDVRLSK